MTRYGVNKMLWNNNLMKVVINFFFRNLEYYSKGSSWMNLTEIDIKGGQFGQNTSFLLKKVYFEAKLRHT